MGKSWRERERFHYDNGDYNEISLVCQNFLGSIGRAFHVEKDLQFI